MRKYNVFHEVRVSVYVAFVLSGIILWKAPLTYRCNNTDEKCFACGLRTAMDLLLNGKFKEAWLSNRFIAVILIMVVIMAIDVILYYRAKAEYK